jgi:hypothetical protein
VNKEKAIQFIVKPRSFLIGLILIARSQAVYLVRIWGNSKNSFGQTTAPHLKSRMKIRIQSLFCNNWRDGDNAIVHHDGSVRLID